MKLRILLVLAVALTFRVFGATSPDYETLRAEAEGFIVQGSFAKAHELYRQLNPTNLPPADRRWVEFRLADTQWRSQASTQTSDPTRLDEARRQLEALVREVTREEDRDRVWAEAQESLGDFFWTRRDQHNWSTAWPHYEKALDWWAGAPDIELARQRYLDMVWRASRPPGDRYYAGYWTSRAPLQILENALKIARTENDKAHAHFLIVMTLRSRDGTREELARVPEEFEGALKPGKATDWYDDALYHYAEWMAGRGRVVPLAGGGWRSEPDYAKALELFRRLVSEYKKGETRYWEQAQQQIRNITDPQLNVSVPYVFLPDSEIQYYLNWRNVKQINLALYPVELNRDVKFPAEGEQRADWLAAIDLNGREKLRSWTYQPEHDRNKGAGRKPALPNQEYAPGNGSLRLDGKLKPGAYLLEATGGGKSARELILVTDAALVLKTSGSQALVYFCNALNSSPLAGARVNLWESWWDGNRWHSHSLQKTANTNGLAVFDLETHSGQNRQIFASAIRDDRQAFSEGNRYWYGRDQASWRFYAFTDRPAYRPKETVHWKFIVRRYNGSVYSTPSGQKVQFEITDPRGAKVQSDTASLNAFGSAWGSLDLTEQMPLGEYRITFWDEQHRNSLGSATLFRLEEYKLPEFKVTVQTPEEPGTGTPPSPPRKKTFKLGEPVEVTIQADYYFGGPVSDARVEVLVHQHPFRHTWHPPRKYPWFYEDMDSSYGWRGRWYGRDQIVKRENLKTDATGKATLTFDTPANAGQDFEYRIEARVTDASRREIVGSGTVRVTRQRYYVYADPEHNLYRPQDKVTVNFKALDANDQPVQTEGTVKVTRDSWYEIWLAPDGHEVKGAELKRLQSLAPVWPPPPARPDQRDWRLKFRGYEHDDILTRSLQTDTNGEAELTFTPEREGYYRVVWTSEDAISNLKSQISNPVTAETTVWVANNATTELGYRQGGVEIIADKDTFRVGQKAPVMLVANSPDRYVLFSVEGADLYSYQLVHLQGTVKLVELPIQEKHVPNIFLSAALVSDRQIFLDTKQIVVPPVKNFLTVKVVPDRDQYEPREAGTLTVTTRDDMGRPVSAEVALGLVDESVYYIQSDYAGDPRQCYFGSKRRLRVRTGSTMNQRSYAKLVETEDGELLDDRILQSLRAQKAGGGMGGGGVRGGVPVSTSAQFSSDSVVLTSSAKYSFNGAVGGVSAITASPAALAVGEAVRRMPASSDNPLVTPPSAGEQAVVVRSDFRSTVFWQPDVVTGKDGKAVVNITYPDSLTSWKATARAVTSENQFGIADTTTRTKQPLIVRLQAPRFFVVGDTATISAVANNNTEAPLQVTVALVATNVAPASPPAESGSVLQPVAATGAASSQAWKPVQLQVPANGEARADWTVQVRAPGQVKLKVTARGDEHADAMERTYTAYEHGIEKLIAKSGKANADDFTVKLDLPKERKPGSTALTVQVTPSMAVTMLDALPYLIDYPYGCTEQTMSRFLPAVITAKTLRDLGLRPEDIMGHVFGGIEPASAAATHPKGKKDLAELDQITEASLERLYDFQHADGGWGWWKPGRSDHWMTAYVVWGLTLARDAGVKVREPVLARARDYLDKALVEEEEHHDMQAFMLHALAAGGAAGLAASEFQAKAFDNLWANREQLNAYTRALLALSAHDFGKTNEARILVQNLENGVKRDERPDASVILGEKNIQHQTSNIQHSVMGTAHWGEDGIYWHWSDGGVEATAFALRALLAIDPQNALIEPVTNWLIRNRRGAQWNSTRDTAIVVLALNDYLRVSGELKADVEYEVFVNGTSVAKRRVSGEDVFSAPSRFAVDPKLVREDNEIRIQRTHGTNPLYFAAEATFFSMEEPIAPAGNEIFVRRAYYKLVGRPTLLKGYVYDREPLGDGDSVKSGERVETVVTIEAKNNYEYLMFEDLKPAGLEAVAVRSGESLYARELKSGAAERKYGATDARAQSTANFKPRTIDYRPQTKDDYTGRTRPVYEELRDRKVALFLDKLPQGFWEIRYDLRAEVPGRFHALPVVGQAMYVPEIRCNGAEIRMTVADAE